MAQGTASEQWQLRVNANAAISQITTNISKNKPWQWHQHFINQIARSDSKINEASPSPRVEQWRGQSTLILPATPGRRWGDQPFAPTSFIHRNCAVRFGDFRTSCVWLVKLMPSELELGTGYRTLPFLRGKIAKCESLKVMENPRKWFSWAVWSANNRKLADYSATGWL